MTTVIADTFYFVTLTNPRAAAHRNQYQSPYLLAPPASFRNPGVSPRRGGVEVAGTTFHPPISYTCTATGALP
jgi:hypothetical protein